MYSRRNISIALSLLISVGLIVVAFVTSSPTTVREVSAEDTEELLKAYAEKDTDTDGLPDWQETLYQTDPNDAHSVQKELTDGEAVSQGLVKPKFQTDEPEPVDPASIPGTAPATGSVTEQFSRIFLESYMTASGGQIMSEDDQKVLLSYLMKNFSAKTSEVLKSKHTLLSIKSSGTVDLTTYAREVEQVLWAYQPPVGAENPLLLMEAYVSKGDDSALPKLKALAKVYRDRADGFARITAPSRFTGEHLKLVRTFDTLANATAAATGFKKDPLPVLGALSLYRPAIDDYVAVLRVLASALIAEGASADAGPGSTIIELARLADSL